MFNDRCIYTVLFYIFNNAGYDNVTDEYTTVSNIIDSLKDTYDSVIVQSAIKYAKDKHFISTTGGHNLNTITIKGITAEGYDWMQSNKPA